MLLTNNYVNGGVDDSISFRGGALDVADYDDGDMWTNRRKSGNKFSLSGLGDTTSTNSDGSTVTTFDDGSYVYTDTAGNSTYYNSDGTVSFQSSASGSLTSPTVSSPTATTPTSTSSGGSILQSIENLFTTVAPTAAQLVQQTQLNNLNIARAEQGLPPISSATIAPAAVFGLTTETESMIMWALVGFGALYLFTHRSKAA